jgi:hypothetical protein
MQRRVVSLSNTTMPIMVDLRKMFGGLTLLVKDNDLPSVESAPYTKTAKQKIRFGTLKT